MMNNYDDNDNDRLINIIVLQNLSVNVNDDNNESDDYDDANNDDDSDDDRLNNILLQNLSVNASIFTLTAIAVDRYKMIHNDL